MRVKAINKYLKISPKKMRLVANMIRGMKVDQAVDHLRFIPKKASPMILKILQSAIANAEHNFNLKKENLLIKEIFIDGGPMIKRWRARAFGRAAMIRRRSSHCSIILEEKERRTVLEMMSELLWKATTIVFPSPRNEMFVHAMLTAVHMIEEGVIDTSSMWAQGYDRNTEVKDAFEDGLNRKEGYQRGYIKW